VQVVGCRIVIVEGRVPVQVRRLGLDPGFVPSRCRANMAHVRQSRPDSGIGFQVKVPEMFQVVPCSLGSGLDRVYLSSWIGVGAIVFRSMKASASTLA